jgi:hypothetical protein
VRRGRRGPWTRGFPAAMQAGQENVSELPNFRLRCPYLPHVMLMYASDPRRILAPGYFIVEVGG